MASVLIREWGDSSIWAFWQIRRFWDRSDHYPDPEAQAAITLSPHWEVVGNQKRPVRHTDLSHVSALLVFTSGGDVSVLMLLLLSPGGFTSRHTRPRLCECFLIMVWITSKEKELAEKLVKLFTRHRSLCRGGRLRFYHLSCLSLLFRLEETCVLCLSYMPVHT